MAERTSESGENSVPPLARYLGAEYSGFLGNLPEKAQAMIEEPFRLRLPGWPDRVSGASGHWSSRLDVPSSRSLPARCSIEPARADGLAPAMMPSGAARASSYGVLTCQSAVRNSRGIG